MYCSDAFGEFIEIAMADRRGKRASTENLLPADRITWARQIWAYRYEVATLATGDWMLREATKAMGLEEEVVDDLLADARNRRKSR